VIGARPGDVLRIDVISLIPRVPYGVISNRHGKGALPNEYPLRPPPQPDASAEHPAGRNRAERRGQYGERCPATGPARFVADRA